MATTAEAQTRLPPKQPAPMATVQDAQAPPARGDAMEMGPLASDYPLGGGEEVALGGADASRPAEAHEGAEAIEAEGREASEEEGRPPQQACPREQLGM